MGPIAGGQSVIIVHLADHLVVTWVCDEVGIHLYDDQPLTCKEPGLSTPEIHTPGGEGAAGLQKGGGAWMKI